MKQIVYFIAAIATLAACKKEPNPNYICATEVTRYYTSVYGKPDSFVRYENKKYVNISDQQAQDLTTYHRECRMYTPVLYRADGSYVSGDTQCDSVRYVCWN